MKRILPQPKTVWIPVWTYLGEGKDYFLGAYPSFHDGMHALAQECLQIWPFDDYPPFEAEDIIESYFDRCSDEIWDIHQILIHK